MGLIEETDTRLGAVRSGLLSEGGVLERLGQDLGQESIDLLGRWGQTDEVKVRAADEFVLLGQRARRPCP